MNIFNRTIFIRHHSSVCVLFAWLLLGCQVDYSTDAKEYTHELKLAGEYEIQIDIDSTEQQQSYYYQVFNQDETLYLAWANRLENAIDIYDLRRRKRTSRISFPEEGPNSLPKLRGFHFFSLDSFLVKEYNSDEIYLISTPDHQLDNEYSLYTDKKNRSADYLSVTSDCPIVVNGHRVYLCARNPYNSYDDYDRKYLESPLGRWVDLKSSQDGHTKFNRYPTTYKSQILPSEFWGFSRCMNSNGELVYSFPIDHNVYVAREDSGGSGTTVASHFLKGDQVSVRMDKNKATNELEEIKYKIESEVYSSLFYDRYREIYLRFYRHSGVAQNQKDIYGSMEDYQSRPASVIIADKKFQKIGECILPNDRFEVRNVLFLPDGIYLSDAHPRNPAMKENIISFSRFVLRKKI